MNDSIPQGRSPCPPRPCPPRPCPATVHVDAEGVRFGDFIWFSHEAILQRSVETSFGLIGERAPDFFARKYRDWVASILAEGSASGEGAEAVGYLIRWNNPEYRGTTTVSDTPCHPDDGTSTPLYAHPQPAQGEPGLRDAYEGAREDLLDWKGRAQRAEARLRNLGWAGVDASEPPSGEHEQRSCEGSALEQCLSERRPIADEVVLPPLPESDEDIECTGTWNGRPREGTYPTWTKRSMQDYAREAVRLNAHPRGLPVVPNGDDGHEHAHRLGVLVYGIDFGDEGMGYYVRLRDFKQVCERGLPAGSDAKVGDRYLSQAVEEAQGQLDHFKTSAGVLLWINARAAALQRDATAEQPSCGQDARDAETSR